MVPTGGQRRKEGFWDRGMCAGVEGGSETYLARLELKSDFERWAEGLGEAWKDPPSRGKDRIRNKSWIITGINAYCGPSTALTTFNE